MDACDDCAVCVQRASRRAVESRDERSRDVSRDVNNKLEQSDSFYHSLLARDADADSQHYEGVDQSSTYDQQSTHMSWDEVTAFSSISYHKNQRVSPSCPFPFLPFFPLTPFPHSVPFPTLPFLTLPFFFPSFLPSHSYPFPLLP